MSPWRGSPLEPAPGLQRLLHGHQSPGAHHPSGPRARCGADGGASNDTSCGRASIKTTGHSWMYILYEHVYIYIYIYIYSHIYIYMYIYNSCLSIYITHCISCQGLYTTLQCLQVRLALKHLSCSNGGYVEIVELMAKTNCGQ